MINSKAQENLKNKVEIFLQNCVIKEGMPTFDKFLNSLCEEAIRQKKKWLTKTAFYRILFGNFDKIFLNDKKNGKLQDLLRKDEIQNLVNEIASTIFNIPKPYIFCFPLPKLEPFFDGRIELNKSIYIDFPKKQESRSYFDMLSPKKCEVFLCIEEYGFISGDDNDIAFNNALSKFKILAHLLLINKVFTHKSSTQFRYEFNNYTHNIPYLEVDIYEVGETNKKIASIPLSIEISRFIDGLYFNKYSKQFQNLALGEDTKTTYFQNKCKLPVLLIENTEEISTPIKSAIEWAFDASVTADETLSFLQICIGLEAILGDKESDEKISLTTILAERLAYLSDIRDRQNSRKEFKDLYKLRGKLVHGRARKLETNELKDFKWGKALLDWLILTELYNLKLDKA